MLNTMRNADILFANASTAVESLIIWWVRVLVRVVVIVRVWVTVGVRFSDEVKVSEVLGSG